MPELLLGPSGSETTLPKGVRVEVPVNVTKDIEESQMSDGTYKYRFGKLRRIWPVITWKPLIKSDIEVLGALRALNEVLRFKNQYEEDTWFDVIINSFNYRSVHIAGVEKYYADMELVEVV